MANEYAGSPLVWDLHNRVGTLEENRSFLLAATDPDTPITVGKTWVQLTGLEQVFAIYGVDTPDLTVSEGGDGVDIHRGGAYNLAVNFRLLTATADGWFEPAVEPTNLMCYPIWSNDTNKGHVGTWIPSALFGFPDAQPGVATQLHAPCSAGDKVVASLRFLTADGDGTATFSAVLYAYRRGL